MIGRSKLKYLLIPAAIILLLIICQQIEIVNKRTATIYGLNTLVYEQNQQHREQSLVDEQNQQLRQQSLVDEQNQQLRQQSLVDKQNQQLREELRSAYENLERLQKNIETLRDSSTKQDIPDCEVIHIAVVCHSYTETRKAIILVKSILLNRKNPLQFHFIVDNIAKYILKQYFETWGLPSVTVSFYSTEEYQYDLALDMKIDGYNILKLDLTEILPQNLGKVLVIDKDVRVVTDIADLWRLFSVFNDKQAIGAVENQHNIYASELHKRQIKMSIVNKGVNTGVLLYDLESLRKLEFPLLVKQAVTRNNLTMYNVTEEDIFNLVLWENIRIFQNLEDKWNIQLTPNSTIDCCSMIFDMKAIYWQSEEIQNSNCKCIEFYKRVDLTFHEIDGNILKRKWFGCDFENLTRELISIKQTDNCVDLKRAQAAVYRTHFYYIKYEYDVKPYDVTLVTQMNIERLGMLWGICKNWDGPISVALYLSDVEATYLLKYIQEFIVMSNRTNVGYHIMFKDTSTSYYPVNKLRNIALSEVKTPYVFLCDVDFIPNYGMYEQLKIHIKNINISDHKKALVVPAFETYIPYLPYPENKTELIKHWTSGRIRPFRLELYAPHGPTNYTRWKQEDTPYKVLYRQYYEPYLVLHKDMPKYFQQFYGFGLNKISHMVELYLNGYEFIVLPDVFIMHLPHTMSLQKHKYYKSPQFLRCLQLMRNEFKAYLRKTYDKHKVDMLIHGL